MWAGESGFQLTPTIASTWAPVGKTPTVHHFDRRDRVSAISGISVSPSRQRLNLYFQLYTDNIRQEQARDFLRQLLRHLRGHVFVLWDGGNPDEGVWKLAKQRLANGQCHDLKALLQAVRSSLRAVRANRRNLRGCITHSALPLFLR